MSADVYVLGDCPRCGDTLQLQAVLNAVSRVDNKTYICVDCGTAEAMFNHYFPNRELPPLDEQILVAL